MTNPFSKPAPNPFQQGQSQSKPLPSFLTPKPNPFTSRGGSGSSPSAPNISIDGNTIIVNGQGYSVPISAQADFIRSHGGSSSLISQAESNAKEQALKEQQQKEAQKQQEIQKINKQIALRNEQNKNLRQTQLAQSSTMNISLNTSPYVKTEITGYADSNGKKIPIRKFIYVDPTVIGEQLERPATDEEVGNFKKYESALSIETGTASVNKVPMYKHTISSSIAEVQDVYNNLNNDLKEEVTYPLGKVLANRGITAEKTATAVASVYPPEMLLMQFKQSRDAVIGFNKGIIEDVKENPLKQVVLYGVGYGLGAGFKAGATGLSAIPKVGGIASSTFKTGAIGYGVYQGYKFAGATASEIAMAKDNKEAGSVLGVALKDTLLLGAGFTKGEKGFDILEGKIRTRGRMELTKEIPQGEYPQLATNKQLQAFKNNIYKEISDEAIAFHTTPDVFYKSGKITPKAGTSELPGLYASTEISTPFAKISGSGKIDSLKAFQKALKEMFAPEKSPGIASLEPKGFREVDFGITGEPVFEGQKMLNAKKVRLGLEKPKYAFFQTPPKQGFMDIPKMKTEIESIARPESGSYEAVATKTGKKYYTEISGVKVPIDSFKYVDEQLSKNLKEIGNNIEKNLINKDFKPKDYPSYKEPKLKSSIPSFSALSSSVKSDISSMQSVGSSVLSDSFASSIAGYSANSKVSSGKSSNNLRSYQSSQSSKPKSYQNYPYSNGGSSAGYSILSPGLMSEIAKPSMVKYNIQNKQKKKSLGSGYNVYGKIVKSSNFFQINHTPLTKSRAEDVGSYYILNSLARTYVVRKAGKLAEEDFEFFNIPIGYADSNKIAIRNFKIKKGRPVNVGEVFIQKNRFLLSSSKEKSDIKKFQKQVKNIFR